MQSKFQVKIVFSICVNDGLAEGIIDDPRVLFCINIESSIYYHGLYSVLVDYL